VHILRQIEKSFWIHPIVLLGDEAQVKACLGSFGHSANLDTRLVHSLRRMYDRLINRLDTPDANSQMMWVMSNLVSVHLEMVLVLEQDRCTICAKRTTGSGIILDKTDGTPR
jgi:hypothetical protein